MRTIILTAIFPRNDNLAVMPTINKINDNLSRFADGKKIRFLNVNDKLADKDGRLFDGMSKDKTASYGQGLPGLGGRFETDLYRTAGATGQDRPRSATHR